MLSFPAFAEACKRAPNDDVRRKLEAQWNSGCFSGRISPELLAAAAPEFWLRLAQAFALPHTSGFRVGAVAVGTSGNGYLGANFEYARLPIHTALHAEQSSVLQARHHGETDLAEMRVSAAPCGHCRQFMHELGNANHLKIQIEGKPPVTDYLANLLPSAFTLLNPKRPTLLGSGPLPSVPFPLPTARIALEALLASLLKHAYAPHSKAPEAALLAFSDGSGFGGTCVENAAFNPSVPAITCALNTRNFSTKREHPVVAAWFARVSHSPIDASAHARILLQDAAPEAAWTSLVI